MPLPLIAAGLASHMGGLAAGGGGLTVGAYLARALSRGKLTTQQLLEKLREEGFELDSRLCALDEAHDDEARACLEQAYAKDQLFRWVVSGGDAEASSEEQVQALVSYLVRWALWTCRRHGHCLSVLEDGTVKGVALLLAPDAFDCIMTMRARMALGKAPMFQDTLAWAAGARGLRPLHTCRWTWRRCG